MAKLLSQLLCSCGGGLPPFMQSTEAGQLGYSVIQNAVRCNNYYDYVTGIC